MLSFGCDLGQGYLFARPMPADQLSDLLANDEHGVVLYETRATKDGQSIAIRTINICHFRDGKISELWTVDEDPYTADPFYG